MTIAKFSPVPEEFQAVAAHMSPTNDIAWFDPNMDQLMYMKEDVPHRTDRVDGFVTLFWHGQKEGQLVGMKFKGFRAVFNLLVKHYGLHEGDFISLVRFIEYGLVTSINMSMLEEMARVRLEQKYSWAKEEFRDGKISLKVLEAA